MRIECLDPTGEGLSGLVPTLITATMELPLDGATASFADSGVRTAISFAAGKPVRATATLARDPVNDAGRDQARPGGRRAGRGRDCGPGDLDEIGGAKIFNTAAALATALIARQGRGR